ncbi:MAG: hypothetical protein QOJ11_1799 [Frankiales bacterium]|jgi:uncharacterized protein (TIGR00725 family)|nr:hypothetical protein [Frankiales bacterium]
MTEGRRVIIIGNLTIDDVVRADGGTTMGQPGGNAIYAALGARLWHPTVGVVTRAGADLPPDILGTLTRLGIELDGVVRTTSATSRAWLLYEADGSRRFVDRSTPDEDSRWVRPADIPLGWLTAEPAPVVHVAPMPFAVTLALVEHIRHISPAAMILVDPHESWEVELGELARWVDVFAPSRDELGAGGIEAGAEALLAQGFPTVVVKLGDEGALIADTDGVRLMAPAPAAAVDVTGAGDTFCGAVAGALGAGHALTQAVARATHTAGWSIEHYGSLGLASMTAAEAQDRLDGVSPAVPRTVAVLGSARLGPDDPRWHEARALGAALGAGGWTVMTGGYGGLMAATAQGAAESGAVVVGLPMTSWVGLEPSAYVSELRWSADYAERLTHILGADVVIALPGGIGTLAEATVVWSALQTEPGAARLVLYGAEWHRLVQDFGNELVVGIEDLGLARVALDVDQAVAMTEAAYLDTTATAGPRG